MKSKTQVRKVIQKYIYQRNRTHYLKWVLDDDWSIRYFFTYDTRTQYVRQWVLKSHYEKIYIILTKNEALEYIQAKARQYEPQEYFSLSEFGKGYRRIVVDQKKGVDCFIEIKRKS